MTRAGMRPCRKDANHNTIRDELRSVFGRDNVIDLAAYGCPIDLAVRTDGFAAGCWTLLEVKPTAKAKLTDTEAALVKMGAVIVVTTTEAALDAVMGRGGDYGD